MSSFINLQRIAISEATQTKKRPNLFKHYIKQFEHEHLDLLHYPIAFINLDLSFIVLLLKREIASKCTVNFADMNLLVKRSSTWKRLCVLINTGIERYSFMQHVGIETSTQ